MDTDVIKAKLVSLQRCMQRIRHKTPSSAQHLAADFDLQDILILNLQRAVQISTDIATTILYRGRLLCISECTVCASQREVMD